MEDPALKNLQALIEVLRMSGVRVYRYNGLELELDPVADELRDEQEEPRIGIRTAAELRDNLAEHPPEPRMPGYAHPSLALVSFPESKTELHELGGIPYPRTPGKRQ